MVFMPGISLTAKMFLPLISLLDFNINAYGINWPFHKLQPFADDVKVKYIDQIKFVDEFVTPDNISRYILHALAILRNTKDADGAFGTSELCLDELLPTSKDFSQPPTAFGHSAGGSALLMAQCLSPGTFSKIILYEPIFIPSIDDAPEEVRLEISSLIERTYKRKALFPSREAAETHFQNRIPFSDMTPPALRMYIAEAFQMTDQGLSPVLEPATEASFYQKFAELGRQVTLGQPQCPVHVIIGSNRNAVASYSLQALQRQLPDLIPTTLDGLGHLAPFTDPSAVAGIINTIIKNG